VKWRFKYTTTTTTTTTSANTLLLSVTATTSSSTAYDNINCLFIYLRAELNSLEPFGDLAQIQNNRKPSTRTKE
jgi:hypothetical protein